MYGTSPGRCAEMPEVVLRAGTPSGERTRRRTLCKGQYRHLAGRFQDRRRCQSRCATCSLGATQRLMPRFLPGDRSTRYESLRFWLVGCGELAMRRRRGQANSSYLANALLRRSKSSNGGAWGNCTKGPVTWTRRIGIFSTLLMLYFSAVGLGAVSFPGYCNASGLRDLGHVFPPLAVSPWHDVAAAR